MEENNSVYATGIYTTPNNENEDTKNIYVNPGTTSNHMDNTQQELLEEILRLSKENNQMLHKSQRARTMESLRGVLRLGVILAVIIVAFVFLKPYVLGAKKIYNQVSTQVETISTTAKDLTTAKDKIGDTGKSISDFLGGLKSEFGDLSQTFGTEN